MFLKLFIIENPREEKGPDVQKVLHVIILSMRNYDF